jgi:thiosulfate/3-mercaptopyruvate sulfurtransferase
MKLKHHRVKLDPVEYETLIDAAALRDWIARPPLGAPPLRIFDCRFDLANREAGPKAYEAGHIPGARFADLNSDMSAPIGPTTGRHPLPDPALFGAALHRWGVTAESQVVAYDAANSSFAARLWWLLRWVGHRRVAVLDGGMQAWCASAGTLESGSPATADAGKAGSERPAWRAGAAPTVDTPALAKELRAADRLIVDARLPKRYAGAIEPLDSVAGHVPGAVNHPFSLNLAADNTFLAADELRRRWQQRLGSRDAAQVIAMCGSGVTACHNLLSLEIAGLPGAALYPGSWSEWIRDARRPVARGESP